MGSLHLALVGVDARGLSHAIVKRRLVLALQNWSYTSGKAAFSALLSRRLLMISFQRRMEFLVLSSSTSRSLFTRFSTIRSVVVLSPFRLM